MTQRQTLSVPGDGQIARIVWVERRLKNYGPEFVRSVARIGVEVRIAAPTPHLDELTAKWARMKLFNWLNGRRIEGRDLVNV